MSTLDEQSNTWFFDHMGQISEKKISNCQPKTDIFPPFTTFTFNHTVDRKIPAPVDLVNIPLVCKVSYTSATVAGWLTFTLLLSQGCLDGVVFSERGQICAPKRKEWQLFHLAGLGIVFVVNFTMANRQFRGELCLELFFPASNSRESWKRVWFIG